jgi:hypothetical protein
MAVEWCAEAFLVEVVSDEADAATENEETVECSDLKMGLRLTTFGNTRVNIDLDVLVCFLRSESTAVPQQINEAYGDSAVDVQDELQSDT